MQNIERFIRNERFYDGFEGEHEIALWLKENPEFYLHIWDGYMDDIHRPPKTDGIYWAGFTRDFHEEVRTYSEEIVEIENLDEYITDLLRYKDVNFRSKKAHEVYELIFDFLTFARDNNLTVMAEYD